MKIKIAILFCLFSYTIFSQVKTFQVPKQVDGKPIVCEKFKLLEKSLSHLEELMGNDNGNDNENNNNNGNDNSNDNSNSNGNDNGNDNDVTKTLRATTRSGNDIQVGESDETEFEVHAAVNPYDTSNIVVGAMKYGSGGSAPLLSFTIYYTNNFGVTWEKSPFDATIPDELVIGGGDPMFIFDENGVAYMTWILLTWNSNTSTGTWAMYCATSTNGGANWTLDADGIEKFEFTDIGGFSDLDFAVDKQWMVTDHSPSSSYKGNIYLTYVDIDLNTGQYRMKVKRRLAGSNTFEADDVIINTGTYVLAQYASIDVSSDGTVYATFFGDTGGNDYGLYVAKSTDGGATFDPEIKVAEVNMEELFSGIPSVAGVSDERLYPCPHVAVDKSNPDIIYVAWTDVDDDPTRTGLDIFIARSTDAGVSWSSPTKVNNDTDGAIHQFYSSIVVNEEGVVFVSWYDQRDDPDTDNTHYYLGYSLDGGVMFEQFNVSSEMSDFGEISALNNDIGPGEYNEIIVTENYAIPFWGDGRTNDGKISVHAAFLNTQNFELGEIKSLNTDFSFTGSTPNPVIDQATFELILKKPSNVNVLLYDLNGRLVETITDADLGFGSHTISFGTAHLASGEYFVTLNTDFGFQTRKIIVMK
ncbi:MAG: T9SS type A sorting domain-containing protein [Bacteroidota bacterium]